MITINLWLEAFRQWFIILATFGLGYVFAYSLRNLKRTQQGVDFDQIILIVELSKVSNALNESKANRNLCLDPSICRHIILPSTLCWIGLMQPHLIDDPFSYMLGLPPSFPNHPRNAGGCQIHFHSVHNIAFALRPTDWHHNVCRRRHPL